MIMVWERYCNASPKPEFLLFSLFIFSFISQLIWVRLGWNFHRWFSIQKQVNWCTIYLFSLKFCTSQHSYPIPLTANNDIVLSLFLVPVFRQFGTLRLPVPPGVLLGGTEPTRRWINASAPTPTSRCPSDSAYGASTIPVGDNRHRSAPPNGCHRLGERYAGVNLLLSWG